jgi:hypothetical protein
LIVRASQQFYSQECLFLFSLSACMLSKQTRNITLSFDCVWWNYLQL